MFRIPGMHKYCTNLLFHSTKAISYHNIMDPIGQKNITKLGIYLLLTNQTTGEQQLLQYTN